jgi:ribosomal protein S18 acetylase RimI-like enzyme
MQNIDCQFVVHPYHNSNAAKVAEFFLDSSQNDKTIIPVTEESWRTFASLPSNSAGKDFAVVEVDDKVVALLSSRRRDNNKDKIRHFRIIVHPNFRQRGIGKALLNHVVNQDNEEDVILQSTCPEEWTAKASFLTNSGFTRVHRELSMDKFQMSSIAISPIENYTIKDHDSSIDNISLARLHNEAYADSFGFSAINQDEFVGQSQLPGCRIRILKHDNNSIGFCQTLLEDEQTACIESLVVSRKYRRHGLGRTLLVDAISYLLDSQIKQITLKVDRDNEPALQLYRSVGFKESGCIHTYRRMRILSTPVKL